MQSDWNIAQINVATALYPLDDPRIAEFVQNLDKINQMAEETDGFVWRLKDEGTGDATSIQVSDDPKFIVNMSVWETIPSLFEFVYKTSHVAFVGKRKTWFEMPSRPAQVLWWVPIGHIPTLDEGLAKLKTLRENGPTREAFNFKTNFPHPV